MRHTHAHSFSNIYFMAAVVLALRNDSDRTLFKIVAASISQTTNANANRTHKSASNVFSILRLEAAIDIPVIINSNT
jgi:hypothetical protein